MKSVVLKKNGNIVVEECDIPKPKKNQSLVKIKNVGVCSSDIPRAFNYGAYNYPLVMGHEISAEIIEPSSKKSKLKKGDRVTIFPLLPCFKCSACKKKLYAQCKNYSYYGSRENGGYSEFLAVNDWNILKIPKTVSFRDAALTEPAAVVYHAIKNSGLLDSKKQSNILIIGSGFLGLMLAEIVRLKKSKNNITIIDRNNFKLKKAIKHTNKRYNLMSKVEWDKFTERNKSSYDYVFEMTGIPELFINSIILTKEFGTTIWVGNTTNNVKIPKSTISSILRKEIKIIGSWNSLYKNNDNDDWIDILKLMKRGFKPSSFVTHNIPLGKLPISLKKMHEHKKRIKKYVSIKTLVNL
jgi:L-iditol 2-dehydrogenase